MAEMITITQELVDAGVLASLPEGFARSRQLVPLRGRFDGPLDVAMVDPGDLDTLDDLLRLTGRQPNAKACSAEELDTVLTALEVRAGTETPERQEGIAEEELLLTADDGGRVAKLLGQLLSDASNRGASDIHIEPGEDTVLVRIRVDGVLQPWGVIAREDLQALSNRVKTLSGLDIANQLIPQAGRAAVKVGGRDLDLRALTMPTVRGESVVLRLLDRAQIPLGLGELGMVDQAKEQFEKAVIAGAGAVFSCGPTGSGKTTTLYAALRMLNPHDQAIVTIEDPVEYRLDGASQVQVSNRSGLTYALGLSRMLQSDPDVIMVGEVRDPETASLAITAALTGHLMLSTIHTRNATGTLVRLADMGIEPYLVASTVECVVAQRLTRKLCVHCRKQEGHVPEQVLMTLHLPYDELPKVRAWTAEGCDACEQTGLTGRTGIFEVMIMSENVRSLIVQQSPATALTKEARKEGMLTLAEDAVRIIDEGLSSPEEVVKAMR